MISGRLGRTGIKQTATTSLLPVDDLKFSFIHDEDVAETYSQAKKSLATFKRSQNNSKSTTSSTSTRATRRRRRRTRSG